MISLGFPNPSRNKKEATRFFTVKTDSIESVADLISNKESRYWSPIIFRNNYRCIKNFEKSFFCVIDVDSGLPLTECIDKLKYNNICSIVGTTFNHQKKKSGLICDRYRIVLPAKSWCFNWKDYKATNEKWLKEFCGDNSAKDAGRFFWWCEEIISIQDGDRIDWVKFVEPKPRKRIVKTNNLIPPKFVLDMMSMRKLSKSGSRHHTLFHVSSVMTKLGFDDETIVLYLVNSKLGKVLIDEDGYGEIERQIGNGIRAGQNDNREENSER